MIRRGVDRFLRDHGVTVESTHAFDNIESIKKAVELDAGIALLPFATVHREVAASSLVAIPLAGCRFTRPLGIIQSRQHNLSSTALRFRELLREVKTNDAASSTAAVDVGGKQGKRSGHPVSNGSAPGFSKRTS
jgi:DNA-binding transcriptional LysR family regulator